MERVGWAYDLPIQFCLVTRERFWARLARHRESAGIAQQAVADRLHISQQRISELEQSAAVPTELKRLKELAAAYEIEPATVFAWAAEGSGAEARQARRDSSGLRKQYDATLAEMRQIVEVNRDINDQIGKDIAEIRVMFSRQTEVLELILAAIQQQLPPASE